MLVGVRACGHPVQLLRLLGHLKLQRLVLLQPPALLRLALLPQMLLLILALAQVLLLHLVQLASGLFACQVLPLLPLLQGQRPLLLLLLLLLPPEQELALALLLQELGFALELGLPLPGQFTLPLEVLLAKEILALLTPCSLLPAEALSLRSLLPPLVLLPVSAPAFDVARSAAPPALHCRASVVSTAILVLACRRTPVVPAWWCL